MRTLIVSIMLVAAPALANKTRHGTPIDVNSASADQLKSLPGMTDDVADKIIAGRPYTDKDQLLQQDVVDKEEYAKIRGLIVAKPPKAIGGQGAVEQHQGPGPATETAPPPSKK
jgi:DNA uptake protein ComE-like DNA-binding protein